MPLQFYPHNKSRNTGLFDLEHLESLANSLIVCDATDMAGITIQDLDIFRAQSLHFFGVYTCLYGRGVPSKGTVQRFDLLLKLWQKTKFSRHQDSRDNHALSSILYSYASVLRRFKHEQSFLSCNLRSIIRKLLR